MIETITPAVCGSRRRQLAALAAFALGALVAAALLGAALGLAGSLVAAREALVFAAALAALATAREAGIFPLPLPQLPFQVPERWRFELPLPVWASGYGAGLGLGLVPRQPVATFWVAAGAALALGRPLASAICLSLYGLGRALVLMWTTARGNDPAEVVETLARRRSALRLANIAALATCAALLATAPTASAGELALGPGSQLDPSVSGRVLAYTQRGAGGSSVIVRVSRARSYRYLRARSPSLDGELVAYADRAGVRVVRWRTGEQAARIRGAASKPALDWPLLVYRLRFVTGRKRLVLANLETGRRRILTTVGPGVDLGRPSLAGRRVAWHVAGRGGSRIVLFALAAGRARVVASTRIGLLTNPALAWNRILWIRERSGGSSVRLRSLAVKRARTIARIAGRRELFWTTALARGVAYATRWSPASGQAKILRLPF